MSRSGQPSPRPVLAILALGGALLACTLSWGEKDSGGADGGVVETEVSSAGTGGAPAVRIATPASGQVVPRGQRLDITVETDATATNFLLNVNGRVTSTKAMPPGQSGPTQAILSWTPDRDGAYTLQVIAYNGTSASAPAEVALQVSGTASTTAPGTTGCTGRVLVAQLNFRDGPGTSAARLGQFDVGETVTVIGRNADSTWYQVQRYNAQQAWTINNNDWLRVEGDCAALPVAG